MAKRALFLLAYAQRLSSLFEEFEMRAPGRHERFEQILEHLWRIAAGDNLNLEPRVVEEIVPGEVWVVDGFYDALAQNVGGLAIGALEGMLTPGGVVARPETAIFDTIRLLLAEMRLGCSDPGDNAEGRLFDDALHAEPLVEEECRFWVGILRWLESGRVNPEELRSHAVRNMLKVSSLQPALALGLAKDMGEKWQG